MAKRNDRLVRRISATEGLGGCGSRTDWCGVTSGGLAIGDLALVIAALKGLYRRLDLERELVV